MKKTLIPIVAILCLLLAIALVACNRTCQHSYDYPCQTECNLCGEQRVVEGQLEHTFQDDGDCTTAVTCDGCNTVVVQANSHDYTGLLQQSQTEHWLECQNDGCLAQSNLQGHSKGADGKCTVCGYVMEEHQHDYTMDGKDDYEHWKACLCGAVDPNNPKTKHDATDDNNCETADICSCGYTVSASREHVANLDDYDCTTATTCQNCDYVFVQALASHDVASYWNAHNTHHFHICLNEGCKFEDSKAPHYAEDDGDCTTALLCDGCGWTMKSAMENHEIVKVDNKDDTHTIGCANCDIIDVTEYHEYSYYIADGICTGCGFAHECDFSINNDCVCSMCEKVNHVLDSQCVCETCLHTYHNVDPTTGICSQCNTFVAAVSITIDNNKTYYSNFDDAIIFADGKNNVVIVLENNCSVAESTFDLSGGSLTIDLNGKTLGAKTNYVLRPKGGTITVKDSAGGGRTTEMLSSLGGKVIIEGGTHEFVAGSNVTINDGYIQKLSINQNGVVVYGGTYEIVYVHKSIGTVDCVLADGYCYYDQDGNVADISDLPTDEYGWYTLQNVTVGKTK